MGCVVPAGRIRAFTLVELAVTTAIIGMVAAIGVSVLVEGSRAYQRSTGMTEAFGEAEFAAKRLALELANVAEPADILTMQSDEIRFNVTGVPRRFERSGSTLLRESKALARNVTVFDLDYYQADGSIATMPAQVRRIAIRIRIQRGGATAEYRTEVAPRAFREAYMVWQEE
jgi:prepilin-type N-terminal cleavage/methylation domain-containing protein